MKYTRLHAAAARDDADGVRAAVADGMYVDFLNDGCPPLHVAVAAGAARAAAALLELGANPTGVFDGEIGLTMALKARDRAMVIVFLVNHWGAGSKELALCEAAMRNDDASIAAIASTGADTMRAAHGAATTPLMLATHFGAMRALRALLAHGASLARLEDALGFAAGAYMPGSAAAAFLLAAAGADPNAPVSYGSACTPLQIALRSDNLGVLSAVASTLPAGPGPAPAPWHYGRVRYAGRPAAMVAEAAQIEEDRVVLVGVSQGCRTEVTFARGEIPSTTEWRPFLNLLDGMTLFRLGFLALVALAVRAAWIIDAAA